MLAAASLATESGAGLIAMLVNDLEGQVIPAARKLLNGFVRSSGTERRRWKRIYRRVSSRLRWHRQEDRAAARRRRLGKVRIWSRVCAWGTARGFLGQTCPLELRRVNLRVITSRPRRRQAIFIHLTMR